MWGRLAQGTATGKPVLDADQEMTSRDLENPGYSGWQPNPTDAGMQAGAVAQDEGLALTPAQASDDPLFLRMTSPIGGLWARFSDALNAERAQWFYWVPVALGAGIAIYFLLPFEPPLALGGLMLAGLAGLKLAVSRMGLTAILINVALLMAIGFWLISLRTAMVGAPVLEKQTGPVEVRGFIELIEAREGGGQRLTLRVYKLGNLEEAARPRRVRIRTMVVGAGLAPGDAVIIKARLSPPAAPALPGGFDFARHAYFAGIGAVGYTFDTPKRDGGAGPVPPMLRLAAAIQKLRRAIGMKVDAVLDGETAGIVKALVTGERGGISEATNDAYRDSGLFHILSISGLHMAIMGGAVFWSVRFFLALFPALALRYPVKKWAALAAAAGSLAYLAISGSSFATVRSFIMISIMFLAILLDRPAIALRNVALAALIILVLYPESLLDVGFQMSFAAVVALVAGYEVMRARFSSFAQAAGGQRSIAMVGALFFAGIIVSTVIASVAVTPFAIYHFHKTQQFAVLANLIAVPICNFVVMPAALATLVTMPFGLEQWPLILMGGGVDAMSATARYVAALPGAVGMLPAISTPAFTFMVAGGLWLLLWQARWRWAGLALIVSGLVLLPFKARPDLLVGRDGRLVAVRTASGFLTVLPAPRSHFELERWLAYDGDGRTGDEAVAGSGLTCDSLGCTGRVGEMRLAVSRQWASVADDCQTADILVLAVPAPTACVGPKAVIDFYDTRIGGTHAVYVEGAVGQRDGSGRTVRIETVAQARGIRPWARAHPWSLAGRSLKVRHRVDKAQHGSQPDAAEPDANREAVSGPSRFSAPLELLDALKQPRPEVEDVGEWN